ncbi:hypothetical protein [Bradyrhizobium erythrophlei]|uniref:Uncharacterized protein n=1 Tax=Bradyrhizobium erythrophlei TaxID=1437360 RepID=A0A1M5PAK8_9BRAD|nr:hypothetical protein [Bradyrhizobium erythrophlei]SHG98772.1 hypothetical protein SAMN05444169_5128 [Bradyrhizobium erythrophlei]
MADNPETKKLPVVPHHEVRETFADQVGFIICDGSTLKLDFEAVRMTEPTSQTPPEKQRHVVARLALSMNCAIDLINQISRLAEELTKSGLIKSERGQVTRQNKPS